MFKVGDWVRWLNMSSSKTFKIDKFDGERYHLENEIHWVRPIELKPWKPKEGEWVVRTQVNGKAGTYISGFDVLMWTNEDVYECEPFIGELPSFVRE